MADDSYRKLRLRAPRDLEDDLVSELWDAATLGVECAEEGGGEVLLTAWFAADGDLDAPRLLERGGWLTRGVSLVEDGKVEGTDWLAAYREHVRPFALGSGFWVDPREPGSENLAIPGRRRLLRLPARAAFGTGSHESTRLAVEMLEADRLSGATVLDVGTGSGILCLVALALGAKGACGFDLDPEAVTEARSNVTLNRSILEGPRPRYFAGTADALAPAARFDRVLVNVLPERIATHFARVLEAVGPEGRLLLSGHLVAQRREIGDRLAGLGFVVEREWADGEWAGLVAGRGRTR